MQVKRKIVSKLFILMLLLAVLITACGQKQESGDNTVLPGNEGDEELDLYGSTVNICADIESDSTTFLSFKKDTGIADVVIQRFKDTEKAYNCTFSQSKTVDSITGIKTMLATGDGSVAFFTEFIYYGISKSTYNDDNTLYPISELSDYIDLNDSFRWGNPNNMEMFANNGKIYGVYPASWPDTGIMSTDYLLVYNQDMVTTELHLPDPREYYEKKQWTREQFVDCVIGYTHQNGDGATVPGFSFNDRHMIDISLRSFGVSIAKHEGDGWTTGYNTPEGYAALDWCSRFFPRGDLGSYTLVNGVAKSVENWVNKNVTMCMLHSNYTFSNAGTDSSSEVIYCGIPYGIMPFPTNDGSLIAQYERCINATLIPATVDEPEVSAQLINSLYAPLPGYETEDALFEYYSNNVFLDERDARLILDMTKVSRYLFHHEGGDALHLNIVKLIQKHPGSEIIAKYENDIEQLADNFVIPAYESLETVFGKTLY